MVGRRGREAREREAGGAAPSSRSVSASRRTRVRGLRWIPRRPHGSGAGDREVGPIRSRPGFPLLRREGGEAAVDGACRVEDALRQLYLADREPARPDPFRRNQGGERAGQDRRRTPQPGRRHLGREAPAQRGEPGRQRPPLSRPAGAIPENRRFPDPRRPPPGPAGAAGRMAKARDAGARWRAATRPGRAALPHPGEHRVGGAVGTGGAPRRGGAGDARADGSGAGPGLPYSSGKAARRR